VITVWGFLFLEPLVPDLEVYFEVAISGCPCLSPHVTIAKIQVCHWHGYFEAWPLLLSILLSHQEAQHNKEVHETRIELESDRTATKLSTHHLKCKDKRLEYPKKSTCCNMATWHPSEKPEPPMGQVDSLLP